LFWVKNANFFAKIFGKNIFKNHNIGPRITEDFQPMELQYLTLTPKNTFLGTTVSVILSMLQIRN
jgi:hypothetical protein